MLDSMSMTLPASIAQLAEHALRKRTVVGSIPTGGLLTLSDSQDAIILVEACVHCLQHKWFVDSFMCLVICARPQCGCQSLASPQAWIGTVHTLHTHANCPAVVPKSTKLKNDRQSNLYLIIMVTLRLDWTGRAVYIFQFGYVIKSCMVGVFVFTLDCNNRI